MTRAMPVFDEVSITCFMVFMPPPAWSEVRWKGEQSTWSVTRFTSPSSKATMSEMVFMTEPGS